MKTTIDIPDVVYRRVKSLAAERGQSVKSFLLEALQQKLSAKDSVPATERGWRTVFGKASANAITELQSRLDKECSTVRPEEWP